MGKNFTAKAAETVEKFLSSSTNNIDYEPNVEHVDDVHGVDSIQHVHNIEHANNAHSSPKNKVSFNLKMDPEVDKYLRIMARFGGVSATKYINNLIQQDMKNRREEYKKVSLIFNG